MNRNTWLKENCGKKEILCYRWYSSFSTYNKVAPSSLPLSLCSQDAFHDLLDEFSNDNKSWVFQLDSVPITHKYNPKQDTSLIYYSQTNFNFKKFCWKFSPICRTSQFIIILLTLLGTWMTSDDSFLPLNDSFIWKDFINSFFPHTLQPNLGFHAFRYPKD